MEQRGDDGGLPGEDQRLTEDRFVQPPERAHAPEQHQQVVAEHGGRQHQGKGNGGIDEFAAAEAFASEQPSHPQPAQERDQRRQGSHAQAEPQRKPVDPHTRSPIIGSLKRAGWQVGLGKFRPASDGAGWPGWRGRRQACCVEERGPDGA